MSASEKIFDWMREGDRLKKEEAKIQEFWDYVGQSQCPGILVEASTASVGEFTAHKHSPHFQGDEYHGHCEVGKGYSVAWRLSGKRHHPNKFPAHIPANAKAAVAKVLKVAPSLLEGYFDYDEGKKILLFEITPT